MLAVVIVSLPAAVHAQAIQAWAQRYNGPGNGNDYPMGMAVDISGNVIVVGGGQGADPEAVTIRYSSQGAALWTNSYAGFANAVAADTNENVFVAGAWRDAVSSDYYCSVFKYSGAGVLLWTNVYPSPGTSAKAITLDASGNPYVVGIGSGNTCLTIKYSPDGARLWARTYSCNPAPALAVDTTGNVYISGVAPNYQDYTTIKYSKDGAQLWARVYQAQGMPFALAVDADGNVVVVGRSGGPNGNDYLTIKYSSAGTLLWTQRFGGPGMDEDDAQAVAVDTSGNVLVTGSTWRAATQADFATIKYSSAGVPLWTNFYNGPGNTSDNAWALALDASGDVYVTGGSDGGGSGWDYATVAYSRAGVPLWTKRYNGPGNDRDEARCVAVDANGNVVVTGFSYNGGGSDFATVKYVTPPIITRQPLSCTNAMGTIAAFTVEAAGSTPLSYQWRRDGTNLVDGGNIFGVATTNLQIAGVQSSDAAGYSVVVTNAYGSVTSVVAQLTVTIPPNPGRFSNLSYSPTMGFSFIFRDATVGQPYRIQRSPSAAAGSWADWQSFTYDGATGFIDVSAAGTERRFYRVVCP